MSEHSKPHSIQDVRDLLDEELRCIEPISVAIGESCGECPPCLARAALRNVEEQFEALHRASLALAWESDDGLCWCDEWFHRQEPDTGYQRPYTDHQETCERMRGLVSNPATTSGEAAPEQTRRGR